VGNTKLFRELIAECVLLLFGIPSNTEKKDSIVLRIGANGRPPFFYGIPFLLSSEVFHPLFINALPYS
jgi:hypothetical protein